MDILLVAAAVAVIALGVLVICLIPAAIELNRTIASVRVSVTAIDQKLQPILDNMQKVTADLKVVTSAAAAKAGDVETVMAALGETGDKVHRINKIVDGVMGLFNRPSAYWTGTKVAWKFLVERMKKKGG